MVLTRRLDLRDVHGNKQKYLRRVSEDEQNDISSPREKGPPVEDKSAVAGLQTSLDAISRFSGDFEFLHPDYPVSVAAAMELTDLGESKELLFFPSLSTALMYLLNDIEPDRLCSRSCETYSHEDARKIILEKQTEMCHVVQDSAPKVNNLSEKSVWFVVST